MSTFPRLDLKRRRVLFFASERGDRPQKFERRATGARAHEAETETEREKEEKEETMDPSVPFIHEPVDTLRQGLASARENAQSDHPLQHQMAKVRSRHRHTARRLPSLRDHSRTDKAGRSFLQTFLFGDASQGLERERREKLDMMRNVYGAAVPLKLQIEEQILSR